MDPQALGTSPDLPIAWIHALGKETCGGRAIDSSEDVPSNCATVSRLVTKGVERSCWADVVAALSYAPQARDFSIRRHQATPSERLEASASLSVVNTNFQ